MSFVFSWWYVVLAVLLAAVVALIVVFIVMDRKDAVLIRNFIQSLEQPKDDSSANKTEEVSASEESKE